MYIFRWMKNEETNSRIIVTQIDAGNLHAVRSNATYVNLSRRLDDLRDAYLARTSTRSQFLRSCSYTLVQLRAPQLAAEVRVDAAHEQDAAGVYGIIPWQELDNIVGLDGPAVQDLLWRPWI
jgi:hypothetical protein